MVIWGIIVLSTLKFFVGGELWRKLENWEWKQRESNILAICRESFLESERWLTEWNLVLPIFHTVRPVLYCIICVFIFFSESRRKSIAIAKMASRKWNHMLDAAHLDPFGSFEILGGIFKVIDIWLFLWHFYILYHRISSTKSARTFLYDWQVPLDHPAFHEVFHILCSRSADLKNSKCFLQRLVSQNVSKHVALMQVDRRWYQIFYW